MSTYILTKSDNHKKKFMVYLPNNKKIHFGSRQHSDYTIHKDPIRRELYIGRHKKNEDWNNLNTAGFWSKWILWNLPSLFDSIKDTERKFNIKIIYT